MRLWTFIALFSALSANANNLVTNGDFATDLSSWDMPFGGVDWSPLDASDSPISGSMMLTDVGEFGAQFTQCINPEPTGPTQFSFSYFVPADVTTVFNNGIALFVVWFDDPGCTLTSLGSVTVGSGSIIQDQWVHVTQILEVPAGADSVRVWPLMVGSGTSDFVSHIDNIFVGDRLFSNGFE